MGFIPFPSVFAESEPSFEKKTNAISNPNIGSVKTAIEEEWNKMSEEFILKACKSFRRGVYLIIEKKNGNHFE